MDQKGITLFQLDKALERTWSRLSSTPWHTWNLKSRDRTRIDFNSTAVRAIFKKLFGRDGRGSKRIPELIFGQPNELLQSF